MTDEMDPYATENVWCAPFGENLIRIQDGRVTYLGIKKPSETSNIWKGAGRIAALSDNAIRLIRIRPSGIEDYEIDGVGVSSGHGENREWFCHTHRSNACPHTKRMGRYRIDHPLLSSTTTTPNQLPE